MLTHHTENGCNLRPGDLLATGTQSGPTDGEKGCLMELSHNGRVPIRLSNGETRAMLEDGDTVILRAWGEREGFVRIALVENTHRLRQAVRNIRAFLLAGSNQAQPASLSEAASP